MISDNLYSLLSSPLSADELLKAFAHADKKNNNVCFDVVPNQNIMLSNRMILETIKHHKCTVVFAVDAMPWKIIEKYKSEFISLIPVTSIAPSTSASVWTSILYGVTPAEHGIYGVVIYDETLKASISLLSNTVFYLDGREEVIADYEPILSKSPNIFMRAREIGVRDCLSLGRLAFSSIASLGQKLTLGSQNFVGKDYNSLLQNPLSLIQEYKSVVCSFLTMAEGRTLVFMYLDFDSFFHENSYDSPIVDALWEDLFFLAHKLKNEYDACSLFVTDHGMAQQQKQQLGSAYGMDHWYWKHSYARPGGAGRIQFFYPKKQCFDSVLHRLEDQVSDSGIVLKRDDFISRYISREGRLNGVHRLGDIIAVATSPSFKSIMSSSVHEHGSVTLDEMLVGMGIMVA